MWLALLARVKANTLKRLVMPLAAATAAALAGCGGEDSTATQTPAAGQQRGPGLTAAQQSCLQQQGLSLPQGGGAPPGRAGQAPPGGSGSFPPGDPSQGGGDRPELTAKQRRQLEQRQEAMAAAFEKCGIELPAGGPGCGAPPSGSQ